jgi:hypothetical protein
MTPASRDGKEHYASLRNTLDVRAAFAHPSDLAQPSHSSDDPRILHPEGVKQCDS